jgi:hypothetical protein
VDASLVVGVSGVLTGPYREYNSIDTHTRSASQTSGPPRHADGCSGAAQSTRETRVLFRYVPARRRRARCFSCPCMASFRPRHGLPPASRPASSARAVAEQPRSGRPDQAPACALIGEHLPLTTGEYNFPLRGSRPPYYFFILRQSSHSHARSEGLCQSSDVVWKQVSLCQCQAVVPRTRGSTRARAGTDSVYLYISLRRRLFIIPSLELEALQHTYLIYSFFIVTGTQKLV